MCMMKCNRTKHMTITFILHIYNNVLMSKKVFIRGRWGKFDLFLCLVVQTYSQYNVKLGELQHTSSSHRKNKSVATGWAGKFEVLTVMMLRRSVFTEELLHSHIAHWWSPDGERLAFLTINDSLVPNMVIPRFTGGLYPKGKQYPYPKVS